MHLLPDAAAAVPDHVADQFPIGYFFPVLGFLCLFLLTRVVGPTVSKGCHQGPGGCCAPPVLPQVNALLATLFASSGCWLQVAQLPLLSVGFGHSVELPICSCPLP